MPHIFAGVSQGKPTAEVSTLDRAKLWVKNIPWAIQSAAWGIEFQHVYIRFQLHAYNCPLNLVCHSTFSRGVDVLSLKKFLHCRKVHSEIQIEIDDRQFCRFLRLAYDSQGIPYDRRQLIGVGLVRLAELATLNVWQPKTNPFASPDGGQICSETGTTLLLHTCPELFEGRKAFNGRDPELVSPADFYHEMLWLAAHKSDRVRFSTREKKDVARVKRDN